MLCPPSSLVLTLRWQLRTAFHHGELGLVKRRLGPILGRTIDAPKPQAVHGRGAPSISNEAYPHDARRDTATDRWLA